ncbi:hypothetical protein XA68_13893 [Ophiocordyceps unilateralis]|uniref:Methyltransferase domain-containing protein n=1 Tax=Ophiocordyceps unilateralis TaxID=268505 RepID=A0A2A9PBK9_OPHUN|nr:hypothetical protein XA68_13893 [Ophiocordyceps unilateralis]
MTETQVSSMILDDGAPSWSKLDLEDINKPARDVLERYSGIPPERVMGHVKDVRDRALKIFPYPCIGAFCFLQFCISELSCYHDIKRLITTGNKFLDLGCCFGQEIRKLVADGVPAANLYGCDLDPRFVELGYELFRDKDVLAGNFLQADILDPESDLKQLTGQLRVVNAQLFFHLFSWHQQVQIAKRIVTLFNPTGSALLVGRQVGGKVAIESQLLRPHTFFTHTVESWKQLWAEVSDATGTTWDVGITQEPVVSNLRSLSGPDGYIMVFVVRRVASA